MRDPTPPAPAGPEPLLTTQEGALADRAAMAEGIGIDALMRAAGAAVARAASAMAAGARIDVLCGPGNNGGDGYVAAEMLRGQGLAVTVFSARPPKADSPAGRAAAAFGGSAAPIATFAPSAAALVVDALYGAGLARPVDGAEAAALARLAASGAPVLAVDVPSGLDGDTGQPLNPVAQASHTVTFFRRKPGHLLWPGRGLSGAVMVADIGLGARHSAASSPGLWCNTPGLWRGHMPAPGPATHKYERGHGLVVSGAELRTGAARLAATAVLHAGAGAVTLAGARAALRIHATQVTAVMLREAATPNALAALVAKGRFAVAVIGPAMGVGVATRARIARLLAAGLPLVLDADALTSLAGHLGLLAGRAAGQPAVLTPHAGEFACLFGGALRGDAAFASLPLQKQTSKVEQARAAARLARAVVVYKGIDTVIAAPDGRAAINSNGGPELATAGSGDVLAGIVAAHLAQGMPAFEAAAAGVWLHAACGARYGAGLTAERLLAELRPLAALMA